MAEKNKKTSHAKDSKRKIKIGMGGSKAKPPPKATKNRHKK